MLIRNKPNLLLTTLLAAIVLNAGDVSAQGLFGPAKFKIETSDDRFSDNGLTAVVGRNNRLSNRSPAGGFYIDGRGLYLDPIVIKSRDKGTLQRVGFVLHNETDTDSRAGSPNSFGRIEKVSFVVDGGKLIAAQVTDAATHGDGAVTYNKYLGSASSDMRETGSVTVSIDDMAVLASAHSLAVHVQGSERDWTCEPRQVSKQFLPNLAAFYQQQVVRTPK